MRIRKVRIRIRIRKDILQIQNTGYSSTPRSLLYPPPLPPVRREYLDMPSPRPFIH